MLRGAESTSGMPLGDVAAWALVALTLVGLIGTVVGFILRARAKKRALAEMVACWVEDSREGVRVVAIQNGCPEPLFDVAIYVEKVGGAERPGGLYGELIGTENVGPTRTERFPVRLGNEEPHPRLQVTMYFRVARVLWGRGVDGSLHRAKDQEVDLKSWVRGPSAPEPATVELHGEVASVNRSTPVPIPTYTRQAMREAAGNEVTVQILKDDLVVERAGNATLSDENGTPLLSTETSDEDHLLRFTVHNATGNIRTVSGLREEYMSIDDSVMFLFQPGDLEELLPRAGKGYSFPQVLGDGPTPGAIVFDKEDSLLFVRVTQAHKLLHPSYFQEAQQETGSSH